MRELYSYLKFFICFISAINLSSCFNDKFNELKEAEDDSLVFESFVLEKKNNPHLSEDIVFEIKNKSIQGALKTYFFNSIPTFSTNAKRVEIQNLEQISSNNQVDFRKPITYKLIS
jgi:hypothetical protein